MLIGGSDTRWIKHRLITLLFTVYRVCEGVWGVFSAVAKVTTRFVACLVLERAQPPSDNVKHVWFYHNVETRQRLSEDSWDWVLWPPDCGRFSLIWGHVLLLFCPGSKDFASAELKCFQISKLCDEKVEMQKHTFAPPNIIVGVQLHPFTVHTFMVVAWKNNVWTESKVEGPMAPWSPYFLHRWGEELMSVYSSRYESVLSGY